MTELELKFSRMEGHVPSGAELDAAFADTGLEPGPLRRATNVDRYYDDARLSLSRVGYALRTRMAEGAMLATLKTLGTVEGALHRRDELELPVPEGATAADPWPPEIADRVRMATDPRTLVRAVELTTERATFEVRHEGRTVATVAFDEVEAKLPNSERTAHWSELEIEGEDEATLHCVSAALEGLLTLVPASQTKLERARAVLLLGASLDEGA